jgi:hypothetical protein
MFSGMLLWVLGSMGTENRVKAQQHTAQEVAAMTLQKLSYTLGFYRGLLRTNMCLFHHRRPFFAERRNSAKVSPGLYRFLVPSLPKTLSL